MGKMIELTKTDFIFAMYSTMKRLKRLNYLIDTNELYAKLRMAEIFYSILFIYEQQHPVLFSNYYKTDRFCVFQRFFLYFTLFFDQPNDETFYIYFLFYFYLCAFSIIIVSPLLISFFLK